MQKLKYDEIVQQQLDSFTDECGWNCNSCDDSVCVKIVSIADFPSNFGQFQIIGFSFNKEGEEDHCAIIKGNLGDGQNILVRVHSECLTGDALGSRRCDCGPQLRLALQKIEQEGQGIVLYLRQEGRGIGLTNKLRAYALQDLGYDTYDANVHLGFKPEERNFEIAAEMLRVLGVKSVRLMTNNPEKVEQLEQLGITISERIHHEIPPHKDDKAYLITKKERFGHNLNLDEVN
jgi:3,4-dihydroxy 2-butanone 4-phosphate synthase / GTP cyclohydrolase II